MRPFASVLCSLFALSVSSSGFAQDAAKIKPTPDVIVFNNGDQLTGKFLRGVGGSLVFKSDMAGEVTISLDKVKELRSSGGFAVLKKDAKLTKVPPAIKGNVGIADGSVTVETSPAATREVVPVKDVAYIIDRSTFEREVARQRSFLAGWGGNVNGGATLVRSTTSVNTYTVGVALVRAVPAVPYIPARNRTTLNVVETYGKLTTPNNPLAGLTFSEVKTSIFHADTERDEYFSPRFYALAGAAFDHNYSQGLQLQQTYGGGIGWTAVKRSNQQLDLKADVHYEKQKYLSLVTGGTAAPSQNLVGSTVSDVYKRTLPYKLVFSEAANFMAAFNNSNAYAANVTAGLALPVYKRLAVQFSTTDNFLNNPAPGFNKNSYHFVTGVSYALR